MEQKTTIWKRVNIWLGRTVILTVILLMVMGAISFLSFAGEKEKTLEEQYFKDKYNGVLLEEKIDKVLSTDKYREFRVLKDNKEWRVFEAKENIVKYNESLKSGLK